VADLERVREWSRPCRSWRRSRTTWRESKRNGDAARRDDEADADLTMSASQWRRMLGTSRMSTPCNGRLQQGRDVGRRLVRAVEHSATAPAFTGRHPGSSRRTPRGDGLSSPGASAFGPGFSAARRDHRNVNGTSTFFGSLPHDDLRRNTGRIAKPMPDHQRGEPALERKMPKASAPQIARATTVCWRSGREALARWKPGRPGIPTRARM